MPDYLKLIEKDEITCYPVVLSDAMQKAVTEFKAKHL